MSFNFIITVLCLSYIWTFSLMLIQTWNMDENSAKQIYFIPLTNTNYKVNFDINQKPFFES